MQENLFFQSKVSSIVEDLKLLSDDYKEKTIKGFPITKPNSFGKNFMNLVEDYKIKFFECSFPQYGITLKNYYVYNLHRTQKIFDIIFEINTFFLNKPIVFANKLTLIQDGGGLMYKSSEITINTKSDKYMKNFFINNYFISDATNHDFEDLGSFFEFFVNPQFDKKSLSARYIITSIDFSKTMSNIDFELVKKMFWSQPDDNQFSNILFSIFKKPQIKSARFKV